MRASFILVGVACLCNVAAFAQSRVTLAIDTKMPGHAIPPDFAGLSFETQSLQYNSPRVKGYLFDGGNIQLLTLFHNIGVKNLRIGGTSVDWNDADYIPTPRDIDVLFHFAEASDMEVIYSLRLFNGDSSQDAVAAKYVCDHYKKDLLCFAIGNEPNLYKNKDKEITNASSFFVKWSRFAAAVTNAVPDVKIGGPDTGTGGASWVPLFAQREAGSPSFGYIFSHFYIGGSSARKTVRQIIDGMLSPAWDNVKNPKYYQIVGAAAVSNGIPYRLTEFNNYVAPFPGVWGGNNAFATSLFALDGMHWWAEHDCSGVNFHTVVGKYNGTIYCDTNGNYQVWPIAYGIKAFDVGSHGRVTPITIANPDHLNLTAYAVTGTNGDLYVTIINKEHGIGARSASVTINAGGFASAKSAVMFLTAPNGDVEATHGMTLGGAAITNDGPWRGQWTTLNSANVTVPAASAAIVKILAQ